MGVKNSFYFVGAYAKSHEAVNNVRAGINQVDFSLKHHNAGHGRSIDIPAVTVTGMNNPEVLPFYIMEAERIRGLIFCKVREIEIDLHGLIFKKELKDIQSPAADGDPVFYFNRLISDYN